MSEVDVMVKSGQHSIQAVGEDNFVDWKGSKRGEGCVIDFYTEMILEGRGFQVKAGTVTTPLVGDVLIIDTAAELCVDAPQGICDIIVFANISINLATGTLHEYAIKTVDAVSTGGTAFVPLLLLGDTDGSACMSTARVTAEGGVTVSAEAITTTRRLWSVSNPLIVAAGHEITTHNYQPRMPHAIANAGCCYMQIGAAGTGPSYFATLDFIELPWVSVS